MPSPPPKPLALRAFNRAGAVLRGLGVPLVRLDQQDLMARASRSTGLSDFGDPTFHEPLRLLLDSFEREAHLTTLGRVIARSDIVRLLENRLHIVDTLKREPSITAAPIRSPIFVIGLPRTGTTILHELLAQDPANRVPLSWEVQTVWPPPERATYDTDPRIAIVEKHFAGVDRIIPGFKQMHPMGALLPQECVALMAHDFATMIFHTTHDVLTYQTWLEATDARWIYTSHKRQLQYLQWRCPADRWVLKSPQHLWMLGALLAIYPDARIVQTHRDPLKVIASLTSLVTYLRSMASDHHDPLAIATDWTARLARGLENTMSVRDRTQLEPQRVFDMQFTEFIADEVAMVRRIYDHFGIELSAAAESRMRRFLAANPADKHGRHRYTLADAGLDAATERRRYAAYQERFGVKSESA